MFILKRESKIRRGQVHLNKDEDDRLLSTPEYHTLTINFEWTGEDMHKNECGYLTILPLCIYMERGYMHYMNV